MATRNQLIIVTAICFLGLMGPMYFFFEPGQKALEENATASLPTEPGYFIPSSSYSAKLSASIDYKQPVLVAKGTADIANAKALELAIKPIPGVKSVNVTKSDNPGSGGLYLLSFVVELNDGNDGARVGYLLPKRLKGVAITEIAQPASITLPGEVTMVSQSGAERNISTADASVNALVFAYAKQGESYDFNAALHEAAGLKSITALMIGSDPGYPTESQEYNASVVVKRIVGFGVESDVPLGTNVSKESLEASLSSYGANVSYQEPSPFVQVNASNSSLFIRAFNDSGARDLVSLAFVPYSDGVGARIEAALKKAGVTGTYELPTGYLQVRSVSRVPASMMPGNVSLEFSLADIELPEALGNQSLGEMRELPGRMMPVGAKEGGSVDAVVSLTLVFGELDSMNAVASSLK